MKRRKLYNFHEKRAIFSFRMKSTFPSQKLFSLLRSQKNSFFFHEKETFRGLLLHQLNKSGSSTKGQKRNNRQPRRKFGVIRTGESKLDGERMGLFFTYFTFTCNNWSTFFFRILLTYVRARIYEVIQESSQSSYVRDSQCFG